MVGIKVDLTIKDNVTGEYLRIPVVPPEIPYTDGEALANSVTVLNLGNVDFHSGVDLDGLEWSSFFPARYDASYCSVSDLLKPEAYRNKFSSWKDAGTSLQVICPASNINKAMTIKSFTWQLDGFEGDISYSVAFREEKKIKPVKLAVVVDGTTQTVKAKAKTPAARTAVVAKTPPKKYTVKAGDSLYTVAKKLGVNPWQTLYANNKATIGANPGKLKAGQVLSV